MARALQEAIKIPTMKKTIVFNLVLILLYYIMLRVLLPY